MIHPLAWVGWLVAVMAALSATRNPLHLTLVLGCVALVDAATPHAPGDGPASRSPLRLALAVALLSALLNALSVRYGDTALLWLPGWLPLLGGAVTLEALVFGALNGLALAGLVLAFAAAQRALPTSALVGLIPRVFYPLAVVAAIAITLIPTTLRQVRQIREAQAIRGHRMRHLRDWLPLLLPLLIGGLERALQLAESMAARGFAVAAREGRGQTLTQLAVVGGLASVLGGWLLLAWGTAWGGQALLLGGSGLVLGALWWAGRGAPHTRYRSIGWSAVSVAVLAGALVAAAALALPLVPIDRAALAYSPYPALRPPRFDPMLGVATLGLIGPAAASFSGEGRDRHKA